MGAPAPSEVIEPLRADPARAAVLCDIDGTLAPIVVDPESAAVPAPARTLLAGLASRYRLVACVSGRRASAARSMVGLDQLTYAGNHGLELLRPGDSEPTLDPALGHRGTAASAFASRLDWARLDGYGLRLEDKGPIQAIHWRGAPDPGLAAQRAETIAELATEQGLVPHFGRLVLELRPVATVDKGIAVRRLIGESGASAALYGGDDRTDLDAFAALRELLRDGTLVAGVRVGVASSEGPEEIRAEADLVVDGPDGFLDLLRAL
jgi:trehalose 6-phosphate phosphatase